MGTHSSWCGWLVFHVDQSLGMAPFIFLMVYVQINEGSEINACGV